MGIFCSKSYNVHHSKERSERNVPHIQSLPLQKKENPEINERHIEEKTILPKEKDLKINETQKKEETISPKEEDPKSDEIQREGETSSPKEKVNEKEEKEKSLIIKKEIHKINEKDIIKQIETLKKNIKKCKSEEDLKIHRETYNSLLETVQKCKNKKIKYKLEKVNGKLNIIQKIILKKKNISNKIVVAKKQTNSESLQDTSRDSKEQRSRNDENLKDTNDKTGHLLKITKPTDEEQNKTQNENIINEIEENLKKIEKSIIEFLGLPTDAEYLSLETNIEDMLKKIKLLNCNNDSDDVKQRQKNLLEKLKATIRLLQQKSYEVEAIEKITNSIRLFEKQIEEKRQQITDYEKEDIEEELRHLVEKLERMTDIDELQARQNECLERIKKIFETLAMD